MPLYKLALTFTPEKPEQLQFRSFALPTIAAGAVLALLYFGRVFFITSLSAVVIAFILEPFVSLLVKVRFPRPVASFVVCSFALLVVYLAGLSTYTQISSLVTEMPQWSQHLSEVVDGVRSKIEGMENVAYRLVVPGRQQQQQQSAQQAAALPNSRRNKKTAAPPLPVMPQPPVLIPEVRIHEEHNPIADYVYARLGTFYEYLLMASFVPFLVYFMLSWRDHLHRSFLQFFDGPERVVATRSLQGIADMVRGFVVGNFVLGILLATASSIAFWLLGLQFPLLAGPLSGFLNLVPYIGLPVAVVPPIIVALAAGSKVSVLLAILLIVASMHLLALNALYPKLVGSRVHLNPLVVTFALMFWGFMWDAAGLLLAIPLTAGIKAVCDNVRGLRPYGKFLGD